MRLAIGPGHPSNRWCRESGAGGALRERLIQRIEAALRPASSLMLDRSLRPRRVA